MIPLLMQNIFTQLYGTANVILLSGYSSVAVSASSVANQIFDISTVLLMMVTTGTVILSSIEIGAKNKRRAATLAGTGFFTVLLAGCVLTAINFFAANPLLSLMNLRGETLLLACEYFKIRALFLPVTGILAFLNQLLVCNGSSKCTLIVGVSSNLLNFLLSYVALYFGLEWMSAIERVAMAAGLAQAFGIAVAVFFFVRRRCPFKFEFEAASTLKILKLGVPGAMVSLMFRISQTVTTGFVALMGDDMINAKVYINNIVSYVPLIGAAIGGANMVFIGRYRGAHDFEKADRCFKQNRMIAILCNLILSLLVLIFHRPLMLMFTSDEEILRSAGVIFLIDLFVQIPRAVNNVSEGGLSANGDVKITFLTSTLSCWLGSVALSYLLCVVFDFQLVGLWLAFATDEIIKATVYVLRWRSGKWQNTLL